MKIKFKITDFFVLLICSLFMFLHVSCDNLFSSFENKINPEKSRKGKVIITVAVDGALPAEYAENSSGKNGAKTATTNNSNFVMDYYEIYSGSSNVGTNYEPDEPFEVTLDAGIHSLTVKGYVVDNQFYSLILTGSTTNPIVIEEGTGGVTDVKVILSPVSSEGQGTVALPITLSGAGIKSYKAVWNSGSDTLIKTYDNSGNEIGAATFDLIADNSPGATKVDSGSYDVSFYFYNVAKTEQDTVPPVYFCKERINVFKNLKTDIWVGNAPYISSNTLTITSGMINNRTEYYVSSLGSDSGDGHFYAPFKTVQKAVDVITKFNDGLSDYSIFLKDDISAAAGDFTVTNDESDIDIGKSLVSIKPGSVLNLKIRSFGSEKRTIDANASAANPGRVMYVGKDANVTLENVEITGGYVVGNNGGGIFADTNAVLSLKSGTVINNNKIQTKTDSTNEGSGVRSIGTFNMESGVTVSNNGIVTGSGGSANGGGLCLKGTCRITGGIVEGNSSTYGGGVYIYDSSTVTLVNVEFRNNSAKTTGGGLWTRANVNVKNCEFIENNARGGAGIYARCEFTITDSDFTSNVATINGTSGGNGGAVCLNAGKLSLSGDCNFTLNRAAYGGAICIGAENGDCEFNFDCGTFRDNNLNYANGSGNCIYIKDTENSVSSNNISKINISGNPDLASDQIIYLGYLAGSTDQPQKYINVGQLDDGISFKLDLGDYTVGTEILKEISGQTGKVSQYYDRFSLVNDEYYIDSDGKLAQNDIHIIYVSSQNGSSTNKGYLSEPVDTVQNAVNLAISQNDNTSFEIILLDGHEDESTEAYDSSSNFAYVNIDPDNALTLKIKGQAPGFTTPVKIEASRTESAQGRVLFVGSRANVTLENIEITGGNLTSISNKNGGGIYNAGTLVIDGCIVDVNKAINGGGIYNAKSLTVKSGEISWNNASNGAGIYNNNSALKLGDESETDNSKVRINQNTSEDFGAGLYIAYSDSTNPINTVTINAVEITENKSNYANAGICIVSSTVTMNNGIISKNKATGGAGGGVSVDASSKFYFYGGEISENTAATNSAGILNNGTVVIGEEGASVDKCKIINNVALGAIDSGGAIFSSGNLTINSATIEGNTANSGGAIKTYHYSNTVQTIIKCPIGDNTNVGTTSSLNIDTNSKLILYDGFSLTDSDYIDLANGSTIEIAEDLTSITSSNPVKVKPKTYPTDENGIEAFSVAAGAGLDAVAQYEKFKVPDKNSKEYVITEDGKILGKEFVVTVYNDWAALCAAVAAESDTTVTHEYHLGPDLTADRTLTASVPIKLIGHQNGTTITRASTLTDNVIRGKYIYLEGADNRNTIEFINEDYDEIATSNSIIKLNSSGTFEAKNCSFTYTAISGDGSSEAKGSVIYANNVASVKFENCGFTSCSSAKYGGVGYLSQCLSLEVDNCYFTGCEAENGGAFYLTEYSKITCLNSQFTDNEVTGVGYSIYADENCEVILENNEFNQSDYSTTSDVHINDRNSTITLKGLLNELHLKVINGNYPGSDAQISVSELDDSSKIFVSLQSYILNQKVINLGTETDKLNCFTLLSSNEDQYKFELSGTNAIVKEKVQAGDVVLKDGTVQHFSSLLDSDKTNVIAIIAYAGDAGDPLGEKILMMGINCFDETRMWCSSTSQGYSKTFDRLKADYTGSYVSGFVFNNIASGSDSFEIIQADCNDENFDSKNYEAWFYSKNYGSSNLSGSSYTDGWYIPSVFELAAIYLNKNRINITYYALKGQNLPNKNIWTCNQSNSSSYYDRAVVIDFSDGAISNVSKPNGAYVLPIREF